MSILQAQRQAANLRTALLDNGVKAVSIELQLGVAGSGWAVDTFKRGLGHHIVSRPPGTPGLGLVKAGRTGKNALGGPLCNGYGGFDEVARIITMAWANHPGEGGPWSVPAWGTVPRDNGRPYIFGWEFEGGIEPWTDAMHEFMARCGAGTLDWLATLPGNPGPAPLECWGEHGHPWAEGRKIDRLGYTAASGRARIAAVRGTSTTPTPRTPQEDDVPTVIINPGQALAVPATDPASVDLHVTVDNPNGATARGESIAGVDLRMAVQRTDRSWWPVNLPGFPKGADQFVTAVGLGHTGHHLNPSHGGVLCVSVENRGFLPIVVTLSPHPA